MQSLPYPYLLWSKDPDSETTVQNRCLDAL